MNRKRASSDVVDPSPARIGESQKLRYLVESLSRGVVAGSADQEALEEIRRIYFHTTKATIQRDLAQAIALLKSMASDADRQRAAVYMDGLSEMRSEWAEKKKF